MSIRSRKGKGTGDFNPVPKSRRPKVEAVQKGPKLEAHQVVIEPLVSEKNTHIAERRNTYTFRVNPLATKTQIKAAVEALFEVKVTGVRTMNRIGKIRRVKGRSGRTSDWKKAYVTLSENDRIQMF
jgi:large subunit ribosomal protein L23